MMIFFLWIIWIWLLITVFIDVFRDKSLSGIAKALWIALLVFFPLFGVLVYLIVRGDEMHERQVEYATAVRKRQEEYVRELAGDGGTSIAEELAKLAELRDTGVLTDDEFAKLKAKLLA